MSKIFLLFVAFLFMEIDKVTPMLRDLTQDHLRMLEALKASDRDWIAVCPPHIAGEIITKLPSPIQSL